jgi:hypothetical protein
MKIDYTLTEDDYLRYNIHHFMHSPALRNNRLLLRFATPLLTVAILILLTGPVPWTLTVCAVVYIAWVIVWPFLHRQSVKRTVAKMMRDGRGNEFVGEFSLELADDRMRGSGNGRVTETDYDRIERIVADGDVHYVYVGSISAYILPDSAFRDEGEKLRFFDLLEEKMRGR